MIVTIKEDIFSDPKHNNELDDFLPFFKKGKHRFHLRHFQELKAFENSEWKKGLNQSTKDLLMESLEFVGARKKEIIVSEIENENFFKLSEAHQYLDKNLFILVEQVEYEKPFILKIFQEFDENKDLIKALQNGWLDFYNGAGSNIESVIKEKLKKDDSTSPLFIKPLHKYLRFFVIKDSDKEYCLIEMDGEIKQQTLPENKTKYLTDNNVPYHILYKREKENYIPDRIYNSFLQSTKRKDKRKDFAKVYLKMNEHQKDFLDIEKGFTIPKSNPKAVKDRNNLQEEIKNLYSDISDADYLKIGFGLDYPNLKSEFSNEFAKVSKADLEKRINHQPLIKSKIDQVERNEFENIIHEIKYLL